MATMPLDLTGSLASNKVTGEIRTIARDSDRFFVPANGAVFDHNGSFKIYNAVSGARLQPNTQYRLLHLVDSAVKITNKNVYAVIHIVDKTITSVRYEYQAVGGVYQNIASTIDSRLSEYLYDTTGSNTIGAIVGVPTQVPPEHHLQSVHDFQGTGALVTVLENIRTAMILGNAPAFAAAYEFIDYRFQQAMLAINAQFDEANRRMVLLEERTQVKNGDYIITTNAANPSTYLGYGNWVLDSNVLLMGSTAGESIGEYIDIGAGTGHVAVKRFFWRRDDSVAGTTYSLSTNSTVVNEGQSVTITLRTTGVTEGTRIAYRIIGITENDLVGGKLTDYFTINSEGIATLVLNIRQDMETEGVEVMRVALTAMSDKYVDVTVNDTSKAATYTMRFSGSANGSGEISSVNEGSKAYLVVNTDGVAAGTRIYMLYNDSTVATEDSETGAWPAYFDVTATGTSIIELSIKEDQLTEGAETLVVNLCTTNNINSRVTRAVLTVNDTSRSPSSAITYSANTSGTNPITSTNEGTTCYAFISTTNINNGEFLDVTYAGTAVSADFTNTLPTRVTVQNNQAMITLNVSADFKTEGDETLIIRALYNGKQLAEKSLIIRDTSVNPSYNLKFSNNSSGTDAVTRANEGQSIYLYLETTNIQDGTVLNVMYSGTADPANDLSNYPRTLTVVGNRASGVVIIKADQASEGEETLIAEVVRDGTSIGTAMLYINDTSASPTSAIRFSTVQSGSNTVTTANEGTTVFAIFETTNIANGTVLNVTHGGTATADDFVNTRAANVTINSNIGSLELQIKNDLLSEGQETYRVTATLPNGETVTSSELKIIDTSVPTLNVYFSGSATGSGQISTINEGQTAYLVIETSGIATGVKTGLAYTGTTVASDISNGNFGTTDVSITGARTVVPYQFANDAREDGNKSMTVTATVPGITGSKAATISITDTSKNAIYTTNGNIVIPAGQVARIIVLSGAGYANFKTANASDLGQVNLAIDGKSYTVGSGMHGTAVNVLSSTMALNGWDGCTTYTPRVNNAISDYLIETPVDRDGIVQMLTFSGMPGSDTKQIKPFNMLSLSAAMQNTITDLADVTSAPTQTINGKQVKPGFGAGANALVLIYKNAGTTARTIPITFKAPTAPSVSGTAGKAAQAIVEFYDTVAQANLGYKPATVFTNFTNIDKTAQHVVKPGESYQITLVSGGGASNAIYKTSPAVYAEGQSAIMYFNGQGGSNNVTVNPGRPSTSEIGAAGLSGSLKYNESPPAYCKQVAYVTTEVASSVSPDSDMYSPISPFSAGIGGSYAHPRLFPVPPLVNNKFIAFGAPGFSAVNTVGVGGSGCAVSYMVTNTTSADITLNFKLTKYTPSGTPDLVNPSAGKPGAVVISRVVPGSGDGSGAVTVTTLRPGDSTVDGNYNVVRGFNIANAFYNQTGRLIDSNDEIVLDIASNYAYVGSEVVGSGITVDNRCDAARLITINNSGIIAGLGGKGAGYGTAHELAGNGGIGINNTSTVNVVVNNVGTLAGGGGGGGAGTMGWLGGGGGAPYGSAGKTLSNLNVQIRPSNGGLILGGGGGTQQSQAHPSGKGGNLGQPGATAPTPDQNSAGAKAGDRFVGRVTVNEISVKTVLNVTSNVTDSGYNVVRGFNLVDAFYTQTGRLPNTGDEIVLNVPEKYAYVGSLNATSGITIDDRCNLAKTITITNHGLISGIGGSGGIGSRDTVINNGVTGRTEAGIGIKNTSTVTVNVQNHGTITGGGGYGGFAGGALLVSVGGSGGAPYGTGSYIKDLADRRGNDATLLNPGISVSKGKDFPIGGHGGAFGQPGTAGGGTNGTVGGPAGSRTSGSVVITDMSGNTPLNVTPTMVDSGYNVARGFNLADAYIAQTGRPLSASDVIVLNIPATSAYVGDTNSPAGITIDERCNVVKSITINNAGLIAGLGGDGAYRGIYPTAGSPGIVNKSTVAVNVVNSGTIGGGGGGAGCQGLNGNNETYHGGRGGMPYGLSRRIGVEGIEKLTEDGVSDLYQRPARLGEDGVNGNPNFDGVGYGQKAGLIAEGTVNITNTNGGVTKGR